MSAEDWRALLYEHIDADPTDWKRYATQLWRAPVSLPWQVREGFSVYSCLVYNSLCPHCGDVLLCDWVLEYGRALRAGRDLPSPPECCISGVK